MYQKRVTHDLGEKWDFWLKPKKNCSERLRIAIESILVQNTNWGNVESVKENLLVFRNKNKLKNEVWDINWWRNVNIDQLKEIIRPGGFHNQKGVYIKELVNNWDRVEKTKSMKERRKLLLSIKGIGHESADAIVLYAYDEPSFVIDTYTKRILHRAESLESQKLSNGYLKWQSFLESNVPETNAIVETYKWLHAYFIHIGNTHCLKTKPKCEKCEINSSCHYYNSREIINENSIQP
jgi:endonuclease-3 related protein